MTVQYITKREAWNQLSDAASALHSAYGMTLMEAYEAAWGGDWSPRLRNALDGFEEAMFLLGGPTLNQHCADCSGLDDGTS